jgi:hypothetical protein
MNGVVFKVDFHVRTPLARVAIVRPQRREKTPPVRGRPGLLLKGTIGTAESFTSDANYPQRRAEGHSVVTRAAAGAGSATTSMNEAAAASSGLDR